MVGGSEERGRGQREGERKGGGRGRANRIEWNRVKVCQIETYVQTSPDEGSTPKNDVVGC